MMICDRCGDQIPPQEASYRGAFGYKHLCCVCYTDIRPEKTVVVE